jgi:hypothetical protein
MDQATLNALKASIRHWQENVDAETPDDATTSASACALCAKFIRHTKGKCYECPIFAQTGETGCGDTPYDFADSMLDEWDTDPEDADKKAAWRAAAQAELDFLKSLLPDSEE